MWQPQTELEILDALSAGTLVETVSFEAKREISSKSSEIAKDISALANTSGGVIVYGIGEDINGRVTVPAPFELKRQIEPSERAPHMVTLKNEQRYYGRSDTGNKLLTEVDVARLYERRQITKSDILDSLDALISKDPFKENNDFIHLHILIKPVLPNDSFIEDLQRNGYEQFPSQIFDEALDDVRSRKLFKDNDYYQGLTTPGEWERRVEGYFADVFYRGYDRPSESSDALHLQVNFDGSGTLFCGWMGGFDDSYNTSRKNFHRLRTAIMTVRFLSFWGELYDRAEYSGKVDIGVAITNLEGGVDSEVSSIYIRQNSGFYASDYKRTLRISASELKEDPKKLTENLLSRLFDSIASGKKDLFKMSDWNQT